MDVTAWSTDSKYGASVDGRAYSRCSGNWRLLTEIKGNGQGRYVGVGLGVGRRMLLHRFIMEVFVGKCPKTQTLGLA